MSHAHYKAEPVSDVSTTEEKVAHLLKELERIELAFEGMLPQEIHFLHVAPSKVREGLTVGADGTDWNPGSGQGVYTYYAAAWHKLG